MPYINQLPVLSNISLGDQLPVYNTNNGDARRVSMNTLLTFFQQAFASPELAVNIFTPTTGFSIAVPTPVASQQWMLIQPVSTLASGTIVLPLNTGTPDGTEILVTTTQTITSIAFSINGATNIFGAPATISAGGFCRIRYVLATNSWYRIN